jgi:hypothetical protein
MLQPASPPFMVLVVERGLLLQITGAGRIFKNTRPEERCSQHFRKFVTKTVNFESAKCEGPDSSGSERSRRNGTG